MKPKIQEEGSQPDETLAGTPEETPTNIPKMSDILKKGNTQPQEELPGPPRRQEKKVVELGEKKEEAVEKETKALAKPKNDNAFLMAAIALTMTVLVLLFVLLKPESKNLQTQEKPSNQDWLVHQVQELKTEVTALKADKTNRDERLKSLGNEIETIQAGIEGIQSLTKATREMSQENRNYISTIYRQVLDLQLKLEAVGGGYTPNRPPKEEGRTVNPYIGNSELP